MKNFKKNYVAPKVDRDVAISDEAVARVRKDHRDVKALRESARGRGQYRDDPETATRNFGYTYGGLEQALLETRDDIDAQRPIFARLVALIRNAADATGIYISNWGTINNLLEHMDTPMRTVGIEALKTAQSPLDILIALLNTEYLRTQKAGHTLGADKDVDNYVGIILNVVNQLEAHRDKINAELKKQISKDSSTQELTV